jgi:hypothetical protein
VRLAFGAVQTDFGLPFYMVKKDAALKPQRLEIILGCEAVGTTVFFELTEIFPSLRGPRSGK